MWLDCCYHVNWRDVEIRNSCSKIDKQLGAKLTEDTGEAPEEV